MLPPTIIAVVGKAGSGKTTFIKSECSDMPFVPENCIYHNVNDFKINEAQPESILIAYSVYDIPQALRPHVSRWICFQEAFSNLKPLKVGEFQEFSYDPTNQLFMTQ